MCAASLNSGPQREEGLLTIPEVARLLRISRATAYAWARDGTLPVVALGPRPVLRVHPEEVEGMLRVAARDSSKERRDAGDEISRKVLRGRVRRGSESGRSPHPAAKPSSDEEGSRSVRTTARGGRLVNLDALTARKGIR